MGKNENGKDTLFPLFPIFPFRYAKMGKNEKEKIRTIFDIFINYLIMTKIPVHIPSHCPRPPTFSGGGYGRRG
jgi:hypothetical protein